MKNNEVISVPFLKEYPISIREDRAYYGLSNIQQTFYNYLVSEINEKRYPLVDGNLSYLYIYACNILQDLLGNHDNIKYDYIQRKMMELYEAYSFEEVFADFVKNLANECLLGMEKYEEYLAITEPEDIFSHYDSSFRCSIKYYIRAPLKAVDIVSMSYKARYHEYTKKHAETFKDILERVFLEDEVANGSWADRLLEGNDMYDYSNGHPIFGGALIENFPKQKFPCYDFCLSPLFEEVIPKLIREAENLLRDAHKIPRIRKVNRVKKT